MDSDGEEWGKRPRSLLTDVESDENGSRQLCISQAVRLFDVDALPAFYSTMKPNSVALDRPIRLQYLAD